MATIGRNYCSICAKEKATYRCEGCLEIYCKNHLQDHQKQLELQLDEIEHERNIFRQILSEQIKEPNKQHLIQQINQWEQQSIQKIQQIAEENRQLILKQRKQHYEKIETNFRSLTDEMKEIRQENDFNEVNLNDLRNKLAKLQKQLDNPANIYLREDISSSLITRVYVDVEERKLIDSEIEMLSIPINLQWKQNAITAAAGNGEGQGLSQLYRPCGICINDEKTIYIADHRNHRIVAWKKDATRGEIVAGGNGNHQLSYPTKVIIDNMNDCLIIADLGNKRVVRWSRRNNAYGETIIKDVECFDLFIYKNEYLYVSDDVNHGIRRWKIGEKEGVVVAGENGCGSDLNQFNQPRFICIDEDESLYVSDSKNHRVVKWTKDAKEGVVVAGGHGEGKSLKQLSYPQGICVDRLGTIYVADLGNKRIVRWTKDAKEGSIIAAGNQRNQFIRPVGLSFDNENNLYISDHDNHRIQMFLVEN